MAKFCLKKKSKRQPARLRYKIEKKVREHGRKVRKEAKKNPNKTKKSKLIQIPNICPFKEDILKEVEALKKRNEEEKQKRREQARLEKQQNTKKTPTGNLESLVQNAETRNKIHDALTPTSVESDTMKYNGNAKKQENSLRTFYKEFKKVVENADVVLEVLDARDPLGSRCSQVEEAVHQSGGNKRVVLILNKADLIPREILDKWIKYLRKQLPTIAFKASTQQQTRKLGRKKMSHMKTAEAMQNSTCVGAELLMSVLGNYCRNKGIKTSIRVGVVGLPNVGKSSIINSLKRSRACNVGSTPGVTKAMQEVQLDSKIKLLDSPGVVFASNNSSTDNSAALKNAMRIESLKDPITPATAILQRANKKLMMELYDIVEYSTPQEFFSLKAARMGKFKKGGIPDSEMAARSLLDDWNRGKIKYYTLPPEEPSENVHISSKIVSEIAQEFDIDNFEQMETDTLNTLEEEHKKQESVLIDGPNVETMDEDNEMDENNLLTENIVTEQIEKKTKKGKKKEPRKKKIDPVMELVGNQKLNAVKKTQFKKFKKDRNRRDKVATILSKGLESFSISTSNDDNYDFKTDYQ